MKKIILFIVFSLGLMLCYYISYKEAYSTFQRELINDAIVNEDYEFFLKFNESFNSNSIFKYEDEEKIYLYETYNEEEYISLIISGLDLDVLSKKEEDLIYLDIIGSKGKHTTTLYISDYELVNIFVLEIELSELKDDCGDIQSISLYNDDLNLFDINTSIELKDFDLNTFTSGYTTNELKNIYTFNSVGSVYINLLLYCLFSAGVVAIILLSRFLITKYKK